MIIAIDFDGTCVTHAYPDLGDEIGAAPVIKRMVECGHHIILFTMRSGEELYDAVEWFIVNGIPLYGVNTNPEQHRWTASPKAYVHLYIDDAALGVPLIRPMVGRPYVDWRAVAQIFNFDENV
jgi:hypothetical protein